MSREEFERRCAEVAHTAKANGHALGLMVVSEADFKKFQRPGDPGRYYIYKDVRIIKDGDLDKITKDESLSYTDLL
jgi:hypothetical protein